MLTVKEINEVSFGKAGFSGYKPEDVDNFIDQVAASFQELLSQRDAAVKQAGELAAMNSELAAKNSDAQKKLAILAQKVELYRQDEEDIKEAILNAQRMSKDMMQEAQGKADAILSDARAKSEAKLLEADEEARRITTNAEADAAKAAKEYAQQVEAKKSELEEVKRQVTAFRSSLIEMYKKHLECIDHIPVFRSKEDRQEARRQAEPEPIPAGEPPAPEPAPEPEPMPEPEPEPVQPAQPEPHPEPVPRQRYQYQEVQRPAAREPEAVRQPARAPRPALAERPQFESIQPEAEPTLDDRVDYVHEQLQPAQLPEEDFYAYDELSSVGINVAAHTDIPEALRREKNNHYNTLEFGDGVEIDGRRRRR